MGVRILFFAACADWAGRRELELFVERPTRLRELAVGAPFAEVLRRQRELKIAVNCEYAGLDAEVSDGDEVAFMPPVCGG